MYSDELDDVRLEVAQTGSAVLTWWPKIAGVGNVALIAADPTYTLRANTGETIAAGTATRTTVNSVTKVTFTITGSAFTLGQDHSAQIDWVYSSASQPPVFRYFDVVRAPYVLDVSVNDLQDELADVGQRLDRLALAQNSSRTREQLASTHAWRAWGALRSRLLKLCESRGIEYPRAVISQEDLRRVHVASTIARILRSEGAAPDSDTGKLAAEWSARVDQLFGAMPDIRLASESSPAESRRVSASRSVVLRRGGPESGTRGPWW